MGIEIAVLAVVLMFVLGKKKQGASDGGTSSTPSDAPVSSQSNAPPIDDGGGVGGVLGTVAGVAGTTVGILEKVGVFGGGAGAAGGAAAAAAAGVAAGEVAGVTVGAGVTTGAGTTASTTLGQTAMAAAIGGGAVGGVSAGFAAGVAAGTVAGSLAGAGVATGAGVAATAGFGAGAASAAAGATATGATAGGVTAGVGFGTALAASIGYVGILYGIYVAMVATILTVSQTMLGFLRNNRRKDVLGNSGSVRDMLDFENQLVTSYFEARGITYTSETVADPSLDLRWRDPDSSASLVSHGYRTTYAPNMPLDVWLDVQAKFRVTAFHYAHALASYAQNTLMATGSTPYVIAIDANPDAWWFQQLPGGATPGYTHDDANTRFAGAELSALFNLGTAMAFAKAAQRVVLTDTRVFVVFPAASYAAELWDWFQLGNSGLQLNGDLFVFPEQVFGNCFVDSAGNRKRLGFSLQAVFDRTSPWRDIPTGEAQSSGVSTGSTLYGKFFSTGAF